MLLAAVLFAAQPRTPVILDAVGDVMLARWVGRRIEREGTRPVFTGVVSEFKHSDLIVGNLECALTSAQFAARKPILLRANPSTLSGLRWAGFSAVSLANNHSGDCGHSGVEEARRLLTTSKIVPIGPGVETAILERKGVKIGFIGLMDLPPDWLRGPLVWAKAVENIRLNSDIVVAMVHWGDEGRTQDNARQRSLAAQLADQGVDLVLGSHPHVLQPIRWIRGWHGRRCLVAFSLGNFLFDARPGRERVSEILSVKLSAQGVVGYRKIPVTIDHGFPKLGSRTSF